MDYSDALMTVNVMKQSLSHLARSIVRALKDDEITAMEGIQLGMQGMQFANQLVMLLQHPDRDKVLTVLEHGEFSMPHVGPRA